MNCIRIQNDQRTHAVPQLGMQRAAVQVDTLLARLGDIDDDRKCSSLPLSNIV